MHPHLHPHLHSGFPAGAAQALRIAATLIPSFLPVSTIGADHCGRLIQPLDRWQHRSGRRIAAPDGTTGAAKVVDPGTMAGVPHQTLKESSRDSLVVVDAVAVVVVTVVVG